VGLELGVDEAQRALPHHLLASVHLVVVVMVTVIVVTVMVMVTVTEPTWLKMPMIAALVSRRRSVIRLLSITQISARSSL
jgi:hypothetical protein